ncbi:MAG TPA: DUF4012 domain-containing protein [Jiangellaceae bacterium]
MAHVATNSDVTPGTRRRLTRNWSRRRIILTGVGAVLLLFALSGVAVAVQGLQARSTLTEAIPLIEQIEERVRAGDSDGAGQTVAELTAATGDARDAATGPHWWLIGLLPWAGDDVRAVSTTAVAIDDVSRDVLTPLVDVAEDINYSAFSPEGGRIDLEPLVAAEPSLSAASEALAEATTDMNEIDPDGLVSQVAGPVQEIREYMDTLGSMVHAGAKATDLLPPMLGADGPRTYLLMFQNTAEMRATGGVASAFAIIEADDGGLSIVHQGTAGDLGLFYDEPVLPLDPGKEAIYTQRIGRFFSGVNLSPDFPTAARLAAEMAGRNGFDVDGVVATDTVALSYLLEATGPLPIADGPEMSRDNAVSLLLSDVYWEIDDQGLQDEFFALAAAEVFAALTGGESEPVELVYALSDAADERRLLVWSAHEEEQQELADTVLSGAFDDSSPSPSTLGVFFNDGTSAKLQYYLETSIEHTETICAGGTRYDTLSVRLNYTAPPEASTDFPRDVTGVGNTGVPTGSVRTNVYFYGAADGEIREVRRDGVSVDSEAHSDGARPVRVFTTELEPGGSVTFEVQMAQPNGGEPVEVWATPTVGEGGIRAVAAPCE